MAIEIKELVVKIMVQDSSNTLNNSNTGNTEAVENIREEIIHECYERILDYLDIESER